MNVALAGDLLDQQAARELARRHLADFCALMDEDWRPYAHTLKVIEYLEALAAREIDRLIVSMPTQHGKSRHCAELYPAHFMGRNPKLNVVIASYGQARANDCSRAVRTLVDDHRWPFETRLDPRSTAVEQWALVTGGELKAGGVGGSLGGFGGSLLIFDDPFKSQADADSMVVSDVAWTFFKTVFMRRQRAAPRFLIDTTRWNDYDTVARLLNTPDGKRWTVLTLPGIADPTPEEPDPLDRPKGAVLWPEGPALPRVDLGELTSREFQAIVQQRPTARDGSIFRREWFSRRVATLPRASRTVLTVDGAWKEGITHSRSAMALWGTNGIDYWPIHVWRNHVEYPELKRKLIDLYNAWRPDAVGVEDAASGMALVQELRRDTSIPIIGIPARGSKEARAESVSPLFEARKVLVPEGVDFEWVDDWIEEHIRFPAGAYNDQVDTTSLALARLKASGDRVFGKISGRRAQE